MFTNPVLFQDRKMSFSHTWDLLATNKQQSDSSVPGYRNIAFKKQDTAHSRQLPHQGLLLQ